MARVVVTGMGIVSSIGNNKLEVLDALRQGKSGIRRSDTYQELGFRSHLHGDLRIDLDRLIDRKLRRFMGDSASFAYLAMKEAIADSGLRESMISHPRTGLIAGSGGGSNANLLQAIDTLREKGVKKVGATLVPRIMASTISACLSVAYQIKGISYSISSACATSAHCIGHAYELIKNDQQTVVFAGGGDEVHWTSTLLFDRMGALSSAYNDRPEVASRPFDRDRDGFVISGGGGILVLEALECAKRRGAKIYAEIIGYGASTDGYDMTRPSGDGSLRCMALALESVDRPIDYINAHATSTPIGDMTELESIKKVFDQTLPMISSTKSLTGHGLGAAGANEAIYSLLMMEHHFISPSINISTLDGQAQGMPIVQARKDKVSLDRVMSNSFGFGGTNASLVFQRLL